MNPTLSVIIPVYKVEDYLRRCVDSVLNQDYRDLEIILVDDGSPDGCPAICDEYSSKYAEVRVVHKANGGLSSARNAGIVEARGKYVTFLDSDDQWAEGALGTLMSDVIREDPDMTLFLCYDLLQDGTLLRRNNQNLFRCRWRSLPVLDYYEELISGGDFHESACTKVLSLSFIRDNGLMFKEGITGEDTEWMFRVLRSIGNVSISSTALFICTSGRAGSISNSISSRNIKDQTGIIAGSLDFCEKNPDYVAKDFEMAQCAYLWSICVALTASLPKGESDAIFSQLKEIGGRLNLEAHPKSRMVARVCRLIGIRATARILRTYIHLHRRNIIGNNTVVS